MRTFIGIDPGGSGGIAAIFDDGDTWAIPMPDTHKDLLDELIGFRLATAMIEQVHSMPGQGVKSTFTFGQNFGALRMALTASSIPYEMVTPQKWQSHFGLPTTNKAGSKVAKKNAHKARAQELFPSIKITHAVADALLIAEYCRRTRS